VIEIKEIEDNNCIEAELNRLHGTNLKVKTLPYVFIKLFKDETIISFPYPINKRYIK
jgi:hypothetical protein